MNSSEMSIDLSAAPSRLGALTSEQRDRLTAILDRYLCSIETDEPIARETLLAENPDLAETLKLYLDGLDDLHGLAGSYQNADIGGSESSEETRAKRIGDFEIVREIGRGGMGVVYEARQISLARRVALKILPFAAMLDSRQVARFKNEAQAAAQLYHPNIVPVHAVGVERGVHFYAMKFIEGQPLDHAIRELARARGYRDDTTASCADRSDVDLDETVSYPIRSESGQSVLSVERGRYLPTVIRIGIQAAEAIHAAHEFGIVHRDIKPSNLLLDADLHLWVTDFGLARCQSDVTLTRSGDLIGTLRYMSPEQATGQSALVDHRSDIYSLGATLYELLTLRPAFGGDDAQNLIRRITQEEPKPLRQLCPDVPLDLQTVIAKAMSKLPADRYATASEFADDLRRVLEGKPTVARPPTLVDRAVKWTRRHTRLVLGTTALSLVAATTLTAGMLYVLSAKQTSDESAARAERFFRAAHDVVNKFGGQTAERLREIPAAAHARQDILKHTLAYYEGFAEEVRDDPALTSDLAITFSKIGELQSEIGTSRKSIEAYREAVVAFNQLAESHPDVPTYRRQLALAHNSLATALARAGESESALPHYIAARELQQQLIRSGAFAHSENALKTKLELAVTHANLGLFYRDTKDAELAKRELNESVQIQEALLATMSQDSDLLRKFAGTYNNLGSLYLDQDPEKARDYFASALDLQERVAGDFKHDLQFDAEWATYYHNLAAACAKKREYRSAADAYAKAINVQERLVKAAPDQKVRQRTLAKAITNLGLVQDRLGDKRDAEASFRRALRVLHSLARRFPNDPETLSGLGGTYNNLGIICEGTKRPQDAAAAYRQAIEHQRAALTAAPEVDVYRDFLLRHLFNYGRLERNLGEIDRAVAAAVERRELSAKDPERLLSVAEELAMAYETLTKSSRHTNTPAAETTPEECARLAIETLRQAKAAGLPRNVDVTKSAAFATLSERAEFRALFDN